MLRHAETNVLTAAETCGAGTPNSAHAREGEQRGEGKERNAEEAEGRGGQALLGITPSGQTAAEDVQTRSVLNIVHA